MFLRSRLVDLMSLGRSIILNLVPWSWTAICWRNGNSCSKLNCLRYNLAYDLVWGGDTVRTTDPDWQKGNSIPYNIKISGEGRWSETFVVMASKQASPLLVPCSRRCWTSACWWETMKKLSFLFCLHEQLFISLLNYHCHFAFYVLPIPCEQESEQLYGCLLLAR